MFWPIVLWGIIADSSLPMSSCRTDLVETKNEFHEMIQGAIGLLFFKSQYMAEGLSLSSYQGDSFVLNVQILASCMPACALYFPFLVGLFALLYCCVFLLQYLLVIAYIYVRVDIYLFVCNITLCQQLDQLYASILFPLRCLIWIANHELQLPSTASQ